MKFGFIGGTKRGYSLFNELLNNNYNPEFAIILKEDEHEHIKVSTEFLAHANERSIPASLKKKVSDEDYEKIKNLSLDFIIVCGWRTLIRPEISLHLKYGLIAAHDSLLPKYRGFAPLNWAIINGETETGVTLFVINDGDVDTGDIVLQETVVIDSLDTVVDVYDKIIAATNNCYLSMIKTYLLNKEIKTVKQIETGASYACKRVPNDGKINWKESSESIYNLVRALVFPFSGAFFVYNNDYYEIRSAAFGAQNLKNYVGRIPGRVISISTDGVEVLCGSGTLLIKELYDRKSDAVVSARQILKSITITLL